MKRKRLFTQSQLRTKLFVVLFTTVLIAIGSCQKEHLVTPVTPDPISDAKSFFDKLGKTTSVDTSKLADRQKLGRTVLWENASLRQRGDTVAVFVPVILDKSVFVSGEDGSTGNQLAFYLRALSYDGQTYQIDLLSFIPEGEQHGGFSGTVLTEDWFTGHTRFTHVTSGTPLTKNQVRTSRTSLMMGWSTICYQQFLQLCGQAQGDLEWALRDPTSEYHVH